MLTCPNGACKKVIAKPLKTLNRQQGSKEQYYACPYCLTEITFAETEKDDATQKSEAEVAILEENPNQTQAKLSECKHYFGYMSEKEHKQQMPEECMLCSQIIDCMAKEKRPANEKTD